MFTLFLIGLILSVSLVIGVACKIANIEEPASSLKDSPFRSGFRRTFFAYRDITLEEKKAAAEEASIYARRAEVEAIQNAIMIASVTSSQIKH